MSVLKTCYQKAFYGQGTKALSPNAPPPLGKEVDLRLYVVSDHAGGKATRRSRTEYFIFLNIAPIIWFSKWKMTVETLVFGVEFVAMKNGMEAL